VAYAPNITLTGDFILDRSEIDYILTNPVRKGLVNNWKDYPLKGSTIHDFSKWD
jgi:hypothetical protein